MVLESAGITYVPIARSWANMVSVVFMSAWILFTAVAAARGGFIGVVWTILVVSGLLVCCISFSRAVQRRAFAQEDAARTKGVSCVERLDGEWRVSWDEVARISVRGAAVRLTRTDGSLHKFSLLGKVSALDFADAKATAAAVRDAISRYAPGKHEE